jgi:hypothetical protein
MTRAAAATMMLGGDYKTLMRREQGERVRFVHCYPAIVRFLGREPRGDLP